ncbi:transcriptional regulator [Thiococcus pfennigii]|nr:helix-turn-helix transcriptional regulator [Thiococcus pfennigii]MBK1699641.1 transcriptional regulator [Thiococcus pfennigii]MBK1732741.1 transcriptional regulator [Thiococcus pfennigii]
MDITAEIGRRLRAARHAQRLSLAQLAALTKSLSKSRISNYEQGIRRMGIEEAQTLARALGSVTATYLLCLDDEPQLTIDELELLRSYRAADERGRDTIRQLAEIQARYQPGEGSKG